MGLNMKDKILTGSGVGSIAIAIGTDYNNYIEIPNKFGDGTNIIKFVNKNPDYNDAEFITCIKSNGTMKIFYYDCPNKKSKYEVLEPGRYAIYLDKNSVTKFYIVKWD